MSDPTEAEIEAFLAAKRKKEQADYDFAADMADEAIDALLERLKAADADVIGGAHAAWSMFTRILLGNGWTACDLGDAAHEMAAEEHEEEDDGDPVTVQ